MHYRRDIDGLRAVAVLPVILFHAGVPVFAGGYAGVDVFFVISGYLIGHILLAEQFSGNLSLWHFWERRARRILPALAVICFACCIAAWLLLAPAAMKDFAQSLAATGLLASNVHFYMESGYFSTAAALKPLLHTWSLAVEEQFYLLLPLLMLATTNRPKALFWWVIGISAASFTASILAVGADKHAAFYLPYFRFWELFAGVLAALYVRKKGPKAGPKIGLLADNFFAGLGLGLILLALLLFDHHTPFPGMAALLPVVGTGLLLVYGGEDTAAGKLLAIRPLVGVGLISYSAYLWHQPVFAFARIWVLGTPDMPVMLLLALLSLVLAALSWRFVEQPLRRISCPRALVLGWAALMLIVFVGLGMWGHVTGGFAGFRLSAAQQILMESAIANQSARANCHAYDGKDISYQTACIWGRGRLDTASFGDSHTIEFSAALAKRLAAKGRRLKHLSKADCPPALGLDIAQFAGCNQWAQAMTNALMSDKDITTVIVGYRLYANLFGGHEAAYPTHDDQRGTDHRMAVWQALIRQLEALRSAGKRVVLVLQVPELPAAVGQVIFRSDISSGPIRGLARPWWDVRRAFVLSRLDDLPAGVQVFDPTDIFCDAQWCYASRDGKALYFDDDHLSTSGGDLLAGGLMPLLHGADSP